MAINMNKKRVIIISLIIGVVIIGIVIWLYISRSKELKIVSELIGTWEIDSEGTKAYQNDISIEPEWLEKEIKCWIDSDMCFYYNKDGNCTAWCTT